MGDENQQNSAALGVDMETDDVDEAGFDSDEEGGLRINEEIYIPPPPTKYHEVAADKSRIMIDKIVNENFKSYAGAITIGEFSERFTCIVGPNGSGKSNIIDSILFVFGYRSTKIRSKKTSSLIHKSATHPDLNKCRVSIHFRRVVDTFNETVEAVQNSALVISRVAFKDNTSYYELNGRRSQFKEIARLLRKENVDLDYNRFLILQGEVEQIAMMKPKGQNENDKGMLEFLEDIIGTSRYKIPLEKLSDTVEKLEERRMIEHQRLRRIQGKLEGLQENMDEAVQYLNIENKITRLQHQLYHCKRAETMGEISQREATNKEIEEDYEKLMETITKIDDEKTTKSKELKEKCKKWDVLQKQKDSATAKYEEIRKKDESLHAELVETNKRRKDNIKKLKDENSSLVELKKVPETNAEKIQECETLESQSLEIRAREQKVLDELMEKLSKKTAPLMSERQKHETKLISLRKDVDQAKGVFDLAESELNIYTSVEETEKAKLDELRKTLQTTTETLEERKQQFASLKTKIPATATSLQGATRELDGVRAKEIEVGSKLKNMRTDFEEKRSAMNASRSRNATIDALMKERRAGRIPGIFGRLGDLGAIDAKYDVAISTACGPLDNVVVDTAETADKCIKFLRDNNVGRATFIPLEKQQRYLDQCRQKQQYPEKVPRLFDLVRVDDERVLVAFYFGLRNTLVANDLNQATRIAYGPQRYRVVTLKGELIEIAGTMSGGGKSSLRGRMGQSVVRSEPSTADLETMQTNLDSVYEEYNALRARQQPLEEQIRTLTQAQKQMISDRDKCQVELSALTTQQPLLQTQIKAQEKKVAASISQPEKIRQLTESVEKARENLKIVEELSEETEKTVARLSNEIETISGGRVKEQQKKINDLTKTIEKAKAEVVRLRVAIKTAERNTTKCEQKIVNLDNDLKNCDTRLHEIQEEKTELENRLRVVIERTRELDEALVERDEIAGTLKEELNALNARETKLKAVKIDLDQKKRENMNILKSLRDALPEYDRKIAKLKLRDIPGETLEPLTELTDDEVANLDEKVVSAKLQKTKQRLPDEIPNMQVINDYHEARENCLEQTNVVMGITSERNKLRDAHVMAKQRRCEEFLVGFTEISHKLKEMYQMITRDGDAELELVDSMDPFNEGVVFSVRPPKKSWKDITNLSGGEKTISSLVLVFALHHYKPSPLYFMDEIDAALDFKNTAIIGHYIKQRAKNSQFIVVSLREEMFGLSNILVGIYKTHDASKSVLLDLESWAKKHGGLGVNNEIGNNRPGGLPATQLPPRPRNSFGSAGRPDVQIAATCPGAIGDVAPLTVANDPNDTLGLGDLSILETPEKTPRRRRGSSSDSVVSGTPEEKATQKRRRN